MDAKDPSFKLRMTDGSAREYLWSIQHGEESIEDFAQHPEKFIRGIPLHLSTYALEIVHNNFKDANGYVEGNFSFKQH